MAEFGVLVGARWRMLRAAGMYWLLAVGYEPEVTGVVNRLYAVYLVLVLGAIVALTWLEVVAAALQAGAALARVPAAPPLPAVLLGLLPAAVALIQATGVGLAWWVSPLRFTWPEIAYVAGAPLPGAAIAASALLRVALLALPIVALVTSLVAVVLTRSDRTALPAAACAVAAALVVMGLDWVAGLARLAVPALRRRRWLAPVAALLFLAAANLVPVVGFGPGRTLAAVVAGRPLWPGAVWLGAVGLALAAGALWLAGRVSMTDVVDESAVYARLAAHAPADRRDPAVLAQVRAQAHRGRRRVWLRLPEARGAFMLAARAGLARLRRPAQILYLGEDLALALSGCWMLADPHIARPWFAWLLIMAAVPPRGLGDGFIADVESPFLRQFLPFSDLGILVADAAVPAALLTLIGLLAWLGARPPAGGVALGALLLPALLALRAICRGFSARPRLGARVRLPFAPVAAVCFGLVLLLGVVAGAAWAALGLTLVFCLALGAILAQA